MRTLIYVPVIHTEADMGSLASASKQEYVKRYGKQKYLGHLRVISDMWEGIERRIESLKLNYEKVRVYQDGLPLCGKELDIVKEVALKESKNYKIILSLVQKGAKLEGTESFDLLKKEYNCLKNIAEIKDIEEKMRAIKIQDKKGQELLIRRDRFIAERISQSLRKGETGILFIGLKHMVDKLLPKDIKITYLIYRLPFRTKEKSL